MKDPLAMLNSFTSVCCCIICMLTCACEGCLLYKHRHVDEVFRARQLHMSCIEEIARLNREEKKELLLDKFRSFQVRVTKAKKYKYTILVGEGEGMYIVCRRGFCVAYNVSHWYIEDVVDKLKKKHLNACSHLNPHPRILESELPSARIRSFAESFNINLTANQLGSLRLSHTEDQMICSSWMTYYFALVGDMVPNSDNEIHLEPIPKKDVYTEYVHDMEYHNDTPVSYDAFLTTWKNVYPHVKVRKYKSSCGHCNTCTMLSEMRRKFRDKEGRLEITKLFAFHRFSTMGERRAYYDRRLEGMLPAAKVLSTIQDGMQQNHCMLPWFGNGKFPHLHIKQHLQGVLVHGHKMIVYRSFANIGGGANLAIHGWLLSLFELYRNGELPKVLYHQIDGGSENANVVMLGLCALLVACGIVDKIVLTRLPVGHTHEDIDALFALIWKKLRDEFIVSPTQFVELIGSALRKKVVVEVVDLFVLPNYSSIISECIDSYIQKFAKEEWTQLQFTFERVTTEDDLRQWPMGVKTTYRAYAQDSYIEIVEQDEDAPEDEKRVSGLIAQNCISEVKPLPHEEPLNVLKSFPTGDFKPEPFILGSRAVVEQLSKKMYATYENDNPDIANEWKHFEDHLFPQSDSAQDYVAESGLFIPFKNELFDRTGISPYEVEARARNPRVQQRLSTQGLRKVVATSCVMHSGNKGIKARMKPPRIVVVDADGKQVIVEKGALNAVYRARNNQREANKAAKRLKKAEQHKQARLDARRKEEGWDLEEDRSSEITVDMLKKRTPGNKQKVNTRINSSDEEDIQQETSSHDSDPLTTYSVGDEIITVTKMRGTIHAINDDGTYHLVYKNSNKKAASREDKSVLPKHFSLAPAPQKTPAPSNRRKRVKTWDYVQEPVQEWVDTGAVDSTSIITGKRTRTVAEYRV